MKIGVCFIENRSLLFENRSLLFWKSELVFLKIGVCFFENRSLFFENRSLFLWKSEFVVLKMGVCFFENRSLIFWKSEFVFLKTGVCCFENGSLFLWKWEFVFLKIGVWFLEIGAFLYENPSIGPRFYSVLLLLSWNKISGGSRRGARGTCPPPLIFRPNWGLRPTDRPPPPYLKVWKIYLSLQNFVYVLVKYLMINLDNHLTLSLHESSDLAVSHLGWTFLVLKMSRDWSKS